jgi:hypothetical protein
MHAYYFENIYLLTNEYCREAAELKNREIKKRTSKIESP